MATYDGSILVAEDDPLVRMDLVMTLESAGYRVVQAEDGRTALRWVDRIKVLVAVVTDLQMPHADGLEVATAARAIWPEVPVIIISGAVNGAKAAATLPGARYMPKPMSGDLLLQELSDMLGEEQDG